MTLTYSGFTINNNYIWRLRASAFDMEIAIPSFSSERMSVELDEGVGNVADVTASFRYNDINCTMTKTPDTEYIEDDSDSTGSDMDIKNILEGTWLFASGETTGETEQATADLNDGSNASLNLKLASDVNLEISDITLTSDENSTGLSGTASVKYSQKWTAYESLSDEMWGKEGEFAFEKDETMKIIQVENGIWRIEDINNSNENIIITVNSNTEIKTVWTGTKDFLEKKCTYDITCIFKKQE
ncbi:MAG: hypothetical protein IJ597_03710 [Synergistaceae bacterium]|nr:hypothetical protein [Synergistaceae bacterium]